MTPILVLAAGLQTSVQGGPRHGYRHLGVGGSGAVDLFSLQVANLLVGNAPTAAALELALRGPTLSFPDGARIALTGADFGARCEGRPLPNWRPVDVPPGAELELGACRLGARGYLAVAGGRQVAAVLGNASTDLRAGFGGHAGRLLRPGDSLAGGAEPPTVDAVSAASWWIDPGPDLGFTVPTTVRVLPGSAALAPADALFAGDYRLAAASDRQGVRLEGATLALKQTHAGVSEPVAPGTVQLPPDGQPIVLLADAQTVGGYPRIGHVIRADLPRLAQLRPGDRLRFQATDAAEAHAAACGQRQRLARIALAIEQARR